MLVSAFITPHGSVAAILDLITGGHVTPVVCPALIDELRRVLHRDKFRGYLTVERADELIDELEQHSRQVNDPDEVPSVCRDPDDDYLIALARMDRADALVSSDRDLTSLDLAALPILTPGLLLDQHPGRGDDAGSVR